MDEEKDNGSNELQKHDKGLITWAVAAKVASKVIQDLEPPVDDFKKFFFNYHKSERSLPRLAAAQEAL